MPRRNARGPHETTAPSGRRRAHGRTRQVERRGADDAVQLAERHGGAGEGDGADEGAQERGRHVHAVQVGGVCGGGRRGEGSTGGVGARESSRASRRARTAASGAARRRRRGRRGAAGSSRRGAAGAAQRSAAHSMHRTARRTCTAQRSTQHAQRSAAGAAHPRPCRRRRRRRRRPGPPGCGRRPPGEGGGGWRGGGDHVVGADACARSRRVSGSQRDLPLQPLQHARRGPSTQAAAAPTRPPATCGRPATAALPRQVASASTQAAPPHYTRGPTHPPSAAGR